MRKPPPFPLPEKLPAGTWLRSHDGPRQTYREATLCPKGQKRRPHNGRIADEGIYESGYGASDTIDFLPVRVIWEALDDNGARILALYKELQSL